MQIERPITFSQSRTFSILPTQISNSIVDPPESEDPLPCPATVVAANLEIPGDESQLRELNFLPTQLDPPVVNLSELSSESPCSSVVQQKSSELANSVPKSYLSLELVRDSISKFDGESDSLIEFIKQCNLINVKVKPDDRKNLLFLIRGRIEGHTNLALSNRREPETLNELINLQKRFLRSHLMSIV